MQNRKLKRGLCMLLVWLQIFSVTAFAKPSWPQDTGIVAEAGVVMDVDSGTMILGQNSHVEYPPASITKILTALIVIENANLDDIVTYSETAMNAVEADSGNKLSLVAGDTMTVEDCLYALLLQSVNQSANALAEYVAGSISGFVDMMNARAAEMGLNECHFQNPSGLNGGSHYVSAYDMAKIACAAYQNPTMLKISEATSHKIGATINNPNGITVQNEHRLVITDDPSSEFYYPAAKAGKTGYLQRAGNTLVTYAEQDGRRLVSVILKGTPKQYFIDGKTLLEFGFSNFKNVSIADNETRYVTGEETVDVNGTSYQPSELMIEPDRVITLPNDAEFTDAELSLEPLPDEHPEGAVALLRYTYNERRIGTAFLLKKDEYSASAEAQSRAAAESEAEASREAESQSIAESESIAQSEAEASAAAESADEVNSAESDGQTAAGEDAEGSAGGDAQDAAENNGSAGESRGIMSLPQAIATVLGVIVIGCAVVIGGYLYCRRKKEAQAAEQRRERRRQRLAEVGPGAEEEFNRLMEEKRNKGKEEK